MAGEVANPLFCLLRRFPGEDIKIQERVREDVGGYRHDPVLALAFHVGETKALDLDLPGLTSEPTLAEWPGRRTRRLNVLVDGTRRQWIFEGF